jgi:galactokinase
MDDKVDTLRWTFAEAFGRRPEVLSRAPGRVNLIGDHTDYNEGYVLPVAIDRSVTVAAAPRADHTVRILSTDYDERDEFDLGSVERSQGAWKNYARGVFWSAIDAGHSLSGVDLAIGSDLPEQSGLASSAAFEVAVLAGAAATCGASINKQDIASLAQQAENEFVGVQCGIMDQLAVVFGEADRASLIDCRTNEIRQAPLGVAGDMAIVVIDSGVERRLAETPYNQRREECDEAAALLGIEALRDVSAGDSAAVRAKLPDVLYRRVRHVVLENERVLKTVDALGRHDLDAAGRLMYESHESLRDDFEVSTTELDSLMEIARRTEGVWGARLTGAGFGGSVVALTRPDASADLARRVQREYKGPDDRPATVSVLHASDGLRVTDA